MFWRSIFFMFESKGCLSLTGKIANSAPRFRKFTIWRTSKLHNRDLGCMTQTFQIDV